MQLRTQSAISQTYSYSVIHDFDTKHRLHHRKAHHQNTTWIACTCSWPVWPRTGRSGPVRRSCVSTPRPKCSHLRSRTNISPARLQWWAFAQDLFQQRLVARETNLWALAAVKITRRTTLFSARGISRLQQGDLRQCPEKPWNKAAFKACDELPPVLVNFCLIFSWQPRFLQAPVFRLDQGYRLLPTIDNMSHATWSWWTHVR